ERRLVDSLFAHADGIRKVEDGPLEMMVRGYIRNNALCLAAGTAQPEEGSEHFWAYLVEYLTGRHFVHGELVSLGVLLMARLQENNADSIRALLERVGVRYKPRELGLTREEFRRSLIDLPAYVRSEGLWHTVID